MKETIEVSRDYIEDALILTRDVANSLVGINDIDAKRYSELADTLDAMLNPTPTMTEADWKRVVKDEFLVTHVKTGMVCKTNMTWSISKLMFGGYDVLRERGFKQPHFQGHPRPELEGKVLVTYKDGSSHFLEACEIPDVDWDSIKEYIVL